MCQCYIAGYLATSGKGHVHNFVCSENTGLPSQGDLHREVISPYSPFLLAFTPLRDYSLHRLPASYSLQCLQPMPNKCVCGADGTVPVAELGGTLNVLLL